MTREPESNSTPEHPIQPQPVFCSSCGSTQFLKHLNGCEDWQIPVCQARRVSARSIGPRA